MNEEGVCNTSFVCITGNLSSVMVIPDGEIAAKEQTL